MSAALNIRPDTSVQSLGTQPDLSLGSFASGFSTPAKPRIPSGSSATTAVSSAPLSTPSPSSSVAKRRDDATPAVKRFGLSGHDEEDEEGGDVLDTPGAEKRWGEAHETPAPGRVARTRSTGYKGSVNLTLRDQEKHIDNLKKENFNIKLKVHFLEERLAQLAPDQIDAALKQNINLKIELQQHRMDNKKLRKRMKELEEDIAQLQRGSGGARDRARELEELLQEREHEIRELRRRRADGADDAVVQELEARNAELESQLENLRGMFEETTEEMEHLRELAERAEAGHGTGADTSRRWRHQAEEAAAENEELRLKIDELAELRSQSRAQVLEEREEREAVEDDLNAARDKLAASQIELQQKEDEIDMKSREIEDLVAEHDRIVDEVEEQWREEVKEARAQIEELRDVLALPQILEQREIESKELRMHIAELEANTDELHDKYETAFANLERESAEKDIEIEATNRELQEYSQHIYQLEQDIDHLKEEGARQQEENAVDKERLEALCAALKEQEELAQHIENLVQELQREREEREHLAEDFDKAEQEHESALRAERRTVEAKESALQSALNDLARTQSLLSQRESDLATVQETLQGLETESKKLGESHTTARFSLQLEVDRLKRDIDRLEDELRRARRELDEREAKTRERDGAVDKLYAENRDLAAQLATQTQAKLNATEKLDALQSSLRTAEAEASNLRAKVTELEQRLSRDQRSLLSAESQYRDQLTERNTLLLTIYQYMDKILGVDKTPPFTNFAVFHDNLITRLKALSQVQLDFDKRAKETEARYTDKLTDMRKQIEQRWRQLDRFEASLKVLAEAKAAWRKKMAMKDGELEAHKVTVSELQAQLISARKPGQADPLEVRALTQRVTNAERRVTNLQNQLAASEEKITLMNQKTTVADSKWEVRVREYETRMRAAEEKVKRERQGGKERALELETQIKSYQRQIEIAQKRVAQLNEIIESAGLSSRKPSGGSGSASPAAPSR
ncbi:hypothetical protein CERSUDRAFT_55205 [Gelatoporia subvermispora B]|uniref:Centrosomin N-terminal motif 1 domain-containing protein n=1 Tax=Ceriporiopsis subvermispora (strain B) TaxID=914234 RepID=M2QPV0_CERS8|nr:hypothetical protein CERSUDRAFT_55205 [Gelatoporia subvermispora B]